MSEITGIYSGRKRSLITTDGGNKMSEELKEKVEKALASIRPMLQADGGDLELVSIDDGVVKVRLKGACGSCPMAQMTMSAGVERAVKDAVPEIKSVEAV